MLEKMDEFFKARTDGYDDHMMTEIDAAVSVESLHHFSAELKIKVLPPGSDRTAMGIVADTFRKLPDTYTGQDVISTSGWGKHGKEASTGGLDFPIYNGGKALMLGVDIYMLTAMHYVEDITPEVHWLYGRPCLLVQLYAYGSVCFQAFAEMNE